MPIALTEAAVLRARRRAISDIRAAYPQFRLTFRKITDAQIRRVVATRKPGQRVGLNWRPSEGGGLGEEWGFSIWDRSELLVIVFATFSFMGFYANKAEGPGDCNPKYKGVKAPLVVRILYTFAEELGFDHIVAQVEKEGLDSYYRECLPPAGFTYEPQTRASTYRVIKRVEPNTPD